MSVLNDELQIEASQKVVQLYYDKLEKLKIRLHCFYFFHHLRVGVRYDTINLDANKNYCYQTLFPCEYDNRISGSVQPKYVL